jgi:glutamate 5-kinase
MNERKTLKDCKRIVFKFGTNVVTRENGYIAIGIIYNLIEAIADLHKEGKETIIVSSGAVGMGRNLLQLPGKPNTLPLKQACAAIGQSRLMYFYEEGFDKLSIITAQLLLTEEDFTTRKKYLNLRSTLNTLLELDVIPIINENDAVSTTELMPLHNSEERIVNFGDNDKLSALVMSKLDADLLVILSDVEGLYNCDPRTNLSAELIHTVTKITPELEKACSEVCSDRSRGGMKTKIEAAKIAVNSGGKAIIANGKEPGIIQKIIRGEEIGTIFLPEKHLSSKKRWIAFASSITGKIIVNIGAKNALINKNASLLPAGVIDVKNKFNVGDVVSILDENGLEFARGMTNYCSEEAIKLIGLHSDEIHEVLHYKNYDALISRDNIVILEKYPL